MKKDIRIKIKTHGSIFTKYLEVDGNEVEISLIHDEDGSFFVKLPDYEVDSEISIYFVCKGIRGASCELCVYENEDLIKPKLKCEISKKPGRIDEILQLKNGDAR